MYYGNHSGHHIQMKWAETPEGPWINFNLGGTYNGHTRRGVFDVDSDSTREDYDHVFSPDVHVDNANHQIVMYYHGENQPSTKTLTTGQDVPRQHANFVATSHWGLNFNDPAEAGGESGFGPVTVTFDGITRDVCLGEDYQHVFKYKGNYYSLSKRAMMMMAPDPSDPWAPFADDPETPAVEPFQMAWTFDTTPGDLWRNDANPSGQSSYYSPAAAFLASSAFANHPNNPHPGKRIFSESQDDGLRLNHCSVNVIPGKEQLEIFFYVRATGATDLFDDVYRIVLDISNPDFQQWTVATNYAGLYLFDVVVTDNEIMTAVQTKNPGADPNDYADPVSMGMPSVFIDNDGSKYLFCTYYSAANGGNIKTSEGQITAIRLVPLYAADAEWIAQYFPEEYPGDGADSDLDGFDNLSEYTAGTNPTNGNDMFTIESDSVPSGFSINWRSVSGRVYSVHWCSSLTNEWQLLTNRISSTQNCWTGSIHSADSTGFYKVSVDLE
jgi:hypothetical protein